ncbi:MAG: hypothetical protein IJI06_09100 [Oscillospiraceae bacterium]|nr:hypothetical protein [Oscillospiraceae bacterium]MBQ6402637.1 hypothetical protein [Oscillospiraceae bacterium]
MITMEEAGEIAAKRLRSVGGCAEYTTVWCFYDPAGADSDGGPCEAVVVMKETGICCTFPDFILKHGGGQRLPGE